MKLHILYFFLIALFVGYGCKMAESEVREKPVARVYDSFLYPADLGGEIPSMLSANDSIMIARRLTEEWIRDQLLLKQAQLFLSDTEKDVKKQVEEYHASLLIFKYKQNLLQQHLDTLLSEEEIKDYYLENSSNYILNSDLVKVNFVKIPKSAPMLDQVRIMYRSEDEETLLKLQDYCVSNSNECIIDSQNWIRFTDLLNKTPLNIDNPGRYLNYNRNIEASDSMYSYFIHIIDRIQEGKTAPYEFVREDIKSVLMNKRKLQYIQDLENTVYKEGLSRNQVEIY